MLLSILIRNLNEADNLRLTLHALKKQVAGFDYEVVVVDNESDDDSVNVATAAGCRVVTLARNAFTFGHALNAGIEQCKGEFILILSAHVILLNEHFIDRIPSFFEDSSVAGLRFVHASDAAQVKAAVKDGPQKLVYTDDANFAADHWMQLMVNHCAAIRKSCWQQQPFDEKIFASEDKQWAMDILKKGYALVYQAPCYYLYVKSPGRDGKIKRMAIETAAKDLITGKTDPANQGILSGLNTGIRRIYAELVIQLRVSKGVKAIKKKYSGYFR